MYCIYVGRTSGQSLKERLKHYINNSNASTVRKNIAKFSGSVPKSDDVSGYVNKLYVSCDAYDMKIKTEEADILCMVLETHEINKYYRICNESVNYKK